MAKPSRERCGRNRKWLRYISPGCLPLTRSEAEREAQRAPVLVVFSGPSGVGKDTVIRAVKDSGFDIHHVVTATTRVAREGEVNGRDYHFVSPAEFGHLLGNHELLGDAHVHGNRYGTPIDEVSRAFAVEQDALLKIDVQGGLQVKRRIPQAVFVLAWPSPQDLVERLRARQTESEEELARRTADAHFRAGTAQRV